MKLVADANVLLSAVLGDRARLVLSHLDIEQVFTSEATFSEVEEYTGALALRRGLSVDAALLAVATLPVTIVERTVYAHAMSQARKLVGKCDPDDIEILALALHAGVPLWSNDNDFEQSGIAWYTTAELLRRLGISRR